jgi:hypothetical protein
MLSFQTIGLFGTCGSSTWRKPFMAEYAARGIPFFNPQVEVWVPECADQEALHLAHDAIILFPVTDETYAAGSLAETGFSIRSALRADSTRFVVVLIAPDVAPALYEQNPQAAEDSRRARKLVQAHLAQDPSPRVFVVNDLATLLEVSLKLWDAVQCIESAKALLPAAAAARD